MYNRTNKCEEKNKCEEANVIDIKNFTETKKKELINQFARVRVHGYYVQIFICKPPIERNDTGIILPDNLVDAFTETDYEYRSCVGLVLKLGSEAYSKDKFDEPWCKIGDFVIFPRASGIQFRAHHALLINVPDDKIIGDTDDPSIITR